MTNFKSFAKTEIDEGEGKIGKGVKPFKKKERKICRKRQARALKFSQVRISTLS